MCCVILSLSKRHPHPQLVNELLYLYQEDLPQCCWLIYFIKKTPHPHHVAEWVTLSETPCHVADCFTLSLSRRLPPMLLMELVYLYQEDSPPPMLLNDLLYLYQEEFLQCCWLSYSNLSIKYVCSQSSSGKWKDKWPFLSSESETALIFCLPKVGIVCRTGVSRYKYSVRSISVKLILVTLCFLYCLPFHSDTEHIILLVYK